MPPFGSYLNIIVSFVFSIEHEEAEVQILLCSPSRNRQGAHINMTVRVFTYVFDSTLNSTTSTPFLKNPVYLYAV